MECSNCHQKLDKQLWLYSELVVCICHLVLKNRDGQIGGWACTSGYYIQQEHCGELSLFVTPDTLPTIILPIVFLTSQK